MSKIQENSSKLVRYRVKFDVLVDSEDPSKPDWILDSLWPSLNPGEDIENFEVELVS